MSDTKSKMKEEGNRLLAQAKMLGELRAMLDPYWDKHPEKTLFEVLVHFGLDENADVIGALKTMEPGND